MSSSIGIIGGGQLGMLLCQAARGLDLKTTVLTPSPDDPAVPFSDDQIYGKLDDQEAAARLVRAADVITFEIENVAPPVLRYLAAAEQLGHSRIAPSASILLLLQNKALQKRWLASNGFPTAPHRSLSAEEIDGDDLAKALGLPFVQKAQRGGYDGRGVQIIRSQADFSELWPIPSMFEAFISNVRELAVLVARNREGQLATYAPVGLDFNATHNVLETVTAPAAVSPAISAEAIRISEQVVDRLGGTGLFAVELFLTRDEKLLINEISPRVHNAGHHTLEACRTSQFQQHLRAIADLPLGDVTQARPAAMRNLLYTPELDTLCGRDAFVEARDDNTTFVHWYGKHDKRPYRKMGHITCLADTTQEAREQTTNTLGQLCPATLEAVS